MWTPDLEVNLFHALKGHKPTGINRFFHMACVHHKLASSCESKDLTPQHIWTHLRGMYNLDTLNELDELPFANHAVEFSLPEEMTNPEFMMSGPSSPATSVASTDDGNMPARPSNLNLTNLKNNSLLTTPDSLASPKRKRNARQAQLLSNSQPSSPAATPGSSSKRRR